MSLNGMERGRQGTKGVGNFFFWMAVCILSDQAYHKTALQQTSDGRLVLGITHLC